MGMIYTHSEHFLDDVHDTVFVEIGSDRYEGSTEYFSNLAQRFGVDFHSVDADKDASQRLGHLPVKWHIAWGSEWCEKVLPSLHTKISLAYLDNFDYIYSMSARDTERDLEQKRYYARTWNIELDNTNCQVEHLKQIIHMYPYFSDHAVVAFDDTLLTNGCWIGKGGACVVYLLAHGWQIVSDIRDPTSVGVVLKRQ